MANYNIFNQNPHLESFARRYANFGKQRVISISFDIDFAPDFMIEHMLSILDPYNVCATFFFTHFTPLLERIKQNPNYEIAIHPFLDPRSTQGCSFDEIVSTLMKLESDAVGNRFHRLQHSYRDFARLRQYGILYDCSVLRFNLPLVLPVWHRDIDMVLLTYTWEDGTCENMGYPMELNTIDINSPGMKSFAFHPLNIYINGNTPEPRLSFLEANSPVGQVSEHDAQTWRCKGNGAETVLISLLDFIKKNNIQTFRIRDIALEYRKIVMSPHE